MGRQRRKVKWKGIRIPGNQRKQIERLLLERDDFSSVQEYVRHCIREQLKRDKGGGK